MPQTDPVSVLLAKGRMATPMALAGADGLPRGLDFARRDPLGLILDPAPQAQVPALDVSARLARFCRMGSVRTFASAAQAVQVTLGSLLRPGDQVILDAALPARYTAAVLATGARPHRSPPASVQGVERRLARLCRQSGRGRLFVCVAGVVERAALTADLGDLVPLCAAHAASLIVDISCDLGLLGATGRGLAEAQGRLGQCDVLIGSLAGTFGVPLAMAATRDPAPWSGDRVLPPDAASALAHALDLVDSAEGLRRRQRLLGNALRLWNHLAGEGLRLAGHPLPVVPVPLPPGLAPQMSALLASAGPLVPLITAPLVGRHHPRWLVRMSSDHSLADIDNLADLVVDVTRAVRRQA